MKSLLRLFTRHPGSGSYTWSEGYVDGLFELVLDVGQELRGLSGSSAEIQR